MVGDGQAVEVGQRVDALRGEAEVLGGFGGVLGDVGGDHLRVHRPGGRVALGLAVDGPDVELARRTAVPRSARRRS